MLGAFAFVERASLKTSAADTNGDETGETDSVPRRRNKGEGGPGAPAAVIFAQRGRGAAGVGASGCGRAVAV